MIKDCFRGSPDMKAYLIAYKGIVAYDDDCLFGSGAITSYLNYQYIEACCVEEAKNLYKALHLAGGTLDVDDPIEQIHCLGVYDEGCESDRRFEYLAFEDRPVEYRRRVHHIGGRVKDLFAITDRQWEAIYRLSEATNSKFLGITKREASEFISRKVKEVSEWKQSHQRQHFDHYGSYEGYEEDEYALGISWLDLCGDM